MRSPRHPEGAQRPKDLNHVHLIDGHRPLSIDDLAAMGPRSGVRFALSTDRDFEGKIERNHHFLLGRMEASEPVYGLTTGFGSSSGNRLEPEDRQTLQQNLVRYHGCGVGAPFRPEQAFAATLIRTHGLARGRSGVRLELLKALTALLDHRIIPVIPCQGSVGASGDLTPLSYVAAALQGERQVWYLGREIPAAQALGEAGLKPHRLEDREALALMNGTAMMTAVAALAWKKAERFASLACELTGLLVELLEARPSPFLPELHRAKPHPGQRLAAERILALLNDPAGRHQRQFSTAAAGDAIQEPYSIRCSPQSIGVLMDTLSWTKGWLETEINGVSDNPIIDSDEELILNGGHFFGGHVAAASDALKASVAQVAGLLDRQLALLMQEAPKVLAENLVSTNVPSAKASLHHGFKAVQITVSALTAEIQKNAMPMSVLSRPTETGNQDVVSMGTTAARDLDHVLGMAADCAAMMAMALRQGFHVAETLGRPRPLNQEALARLESMAGVFEPVGEDRALDMDIQRVRHQLFGEAW